MENFDEKEEEVKLVAAKTAKVRIIMGEYSKKGREGSLNFCENLNLRKWKPFADLNFRRTLRNTTQQRCSISLDTLVTNARSATTSIGVFLRNKTPAVIQRNSLFYFTISSLTTLKSSFLFERLNSPILTIFCFHLVVWANTHSLVNLLESAKKAKWLTRMLGWTLKSPLLMQEFHALQSRDTLLLLDGETMSISLLQVSTASSHTAWLVSLNHLPILWSAHNSVSDSMT